MRRHALPISVLLAVDVAATAGSAQARAVDLVGRWTYSGEQIELVAQPQVKLSPYVGPGQGFAYGGSVGWGSATATTVVTEAQPTPVRRTVTLEIDARGVTTWRSERRQTLDKGCVQSVSQSKTGRVTVTGEQFTLRIDNGREHSASTCGPRSSRALTALSETYRLTRRGDGLSLTSGGVTWTFTRG